MTTFISSLRPKKNEHWLILSIFIYSIARLSKYYLPTFITNTLYVISSVIFLGTIFKNFKGNPLSGISGFMYSILFIWSVCLTFHMFFIDDISRTFTVNNGITTWLIAIFASLEFMPNMIPLFLLSLSKNYNFDFQYLWKFMIIMGICFLIYYPFSFWNMINYDWSFTMVSGEEWGDKGTYGDFIMNGTKGIMNILPPFIMIYFKKFLSHKYWNYFLLTAIGCILMQTFMARRGGIVIYILYIILAWGMYFFNDRKTSKIKILIILVFIIGIAYFIFSYIFPSFLSTILERGMEDTRSGVEDSFFNDMNKTSDWIFGRGWFGQYYDPIFSKYRSSIETGYLALILRGGYLYTVPYIIILLISFFNGYFKSNNLFCKSFAIICLMQLFSLYPYGWPIFNFEHFIIWLGVWICNNKNFRIKNDEIIFKQYFKHI